LPGSSWTPIAFSDIDVARYELAVNTADISNPGLHHAQIGQEQGPRLAPHRGATVRVDRELPGRNRLFGHVSLIGRSASAAVSAKNSVPSEISANVRDRSEPDPGMVRR
jgi:hypothetical protein